MKKLPISIQKIKVENNHPRRIVNENFAIETIKYLFKLEEKGEQWQRTFLCDRDDLLHLRDEINKLIETTTTAEVLMIANDKAEIIDEHYKSDNLCQNCSYRLTQKCIACLFVLQSPLERKLFLELSKAYIRFQTQYPLNWFGENISIEGKTYEDKQNNFKEVLTVVDFYIEKKQTKLCVYTDGHSYHERTEDQAKKDRNIDRKLQELGFQVLRYTGKEVNENPLKIINEIQKWIEN